MGRLLSFMIIISLGMSSYSFAMDEGLADKNMQKQIEDCNKNTAKEWNSELNRCVGKAEARATRNEAKECNAIADIEQRKACHLKLAEKNTGLNGDTDSLNQGNIGKSAIMNGVGSAYAILGFINGAGESGKESTCTSKKIFGVTALAGTVTDIWLHIRTKKKMEELANKYQLDKTQSPYEAQVRALYYLKEEQQTVADIASAEKKRNLLLTLGYGAASAMAIYEIATSSTGGSTHCWQKEPKTPPTQAPPPATTPPPAEVAGGAPDKTVEQEVAVSTPIKQDGPIESRPLDAVAPETAPAPAPAPQAAVVEQQNHIDPNMDPIYDRQPSSQPLTEITATTRNGVTQMKIKGDPNNGGLDSQIVVDRVLDPKGNVIGTLNTKSPPPTINYSGPPPKNVTVDLVSMPNKTSPVLMSPIGGEGGKSMNNLGLDYTGNGGSKFLSGANKVQYSKDGSTVKVNTSSGSNTFKSSTSSLPKPGR